MLFFSSPLFLGVSHHQLPSQYIHQPEMSLNTFLTSPGLCLLFYMELSNHTGLCCKGTIRHFGKHFSRRELDGNIDTALMSVQ